MTHLEEEAVLARARGVDLKLAATAHLASCPPCQQRVAAWQNVTVAARRLEVRTAPTSVPSFEALVAPAVRASGRADVEAVAPSPGRSWRISAATIRWQVRLLPRALAAVTVVGLGLAVAAAAAVPSPAWGARLFADLVVLSALAGAVSLAGRADPRGELWRTLPVSPGAVFLARLVVVLSADLVAAMAASALLAATSSVGGFVSLVSAWLGPALLCAGVALLTTVWRGGWLGAVLGAVVWVTGSLSTAPTASMVEVGVGAVVSRLWTTTPITVGLALALIALAATLAARPGERRLAAG